MEGNRGRHDSNLVQVFLGLTMTGSELVQLCLEVRQACRESRNKSVEEAILVWGSVRLEEGGFIWPDIAKDKSDSTKSTLNAGVILHKQHGLKE